MCALNSLPPNISLAGADVTVSHRTFIAQIITVGDKSYNYPVLEKT